MSEQNDAGELFTLRLRLNKFLADRGICSRRDADLWIESGRVTVNEEIVDVGAYVDDNDQVRVDGELIAAHKIPKRVYIALNKPIDIECTTDTRIDGNIIDFVGHHERIFPIGRLDKDSDGLILLTNDGEIVNKILRAEHNHEKEYLVTVDHKITEEFLRGMAQGVRILRRTTKPCKTYKVAAMTFGIVLTEGMNRQIRKMAEAFNYQVLKLTRVRIMNVTLGHLKLGRWRNLSPAELAQLRAGAAAPKREATALVRGPKRSADSQARVIEAKARTGRAPARRASGTPERTRRLGAASAAGSAKPPRIWADAKATVVARGESAPPFEARRKPRAEFGAIAPGTGRPLRRKPLSSEARADTDRSGRFDAANKPRAAPSNPRRAARSEAERSEFFGQRNQAHAGKTRAGPARAGEFKPGLKVRAPSSRKPGAVAAKARPPGIGPRGGKVQSRVRPATKPSGKAPPRGGRR